MYTGIIIIFILFIIATVLYNKIPKFNKLICYNKIVGLFLLLILAFVFFTKNNETFTNDNDNHDNDNHDNDDDVSKIFDSLVCHYSETSGAIINDNTIDLSIDNDDRTYSSVLGLNEGGGEQNKKSTINSSGSWQPSSANNSYMKIDLGEAKDIFGIIIQSGQLDANHVKEYMVDYSLNNKNYSSVNSANTDIAERFSFNGIGIKYQEFNNVINARYIKIKPKAWSSCQMRASVFTMSFNSLNKILGNKQINCNSLNFEPWLSRTNELSKAVLGETPVNFLNSLAFKINEYRNEKCALSLKYSNVLVNDNFNKFSWYIKEKHIPIIKIQEITSRDANSDGSIKNIMTKNQFSDLDIPFNIGDLVVLRGNSFSNSEFIIRTITKLVLNQNNKLDIGLNDSIVTIDSNFEPININMIPIVFGLTLNEVRNNKDFHEEVFLNKNTEYEISMFHKDNLGWTKNEVNIFRNKIFLRGLKDNEEMFKATKHNFELETKFNFHVKENCKTPVKGCMDLSAINYNSKAEINDNICCLNDEEHCCVNITFLNKEQQLLWSLIQSDYVYDIEDVYASKDYDKIMKLTTKEKYYWNIPFKLGQEILLTGDLKDTQEKNNHESLGKSDFLISRITNIHQTSEYKLELTFDKKIYGLLNKTNYLTDIKIYNILAYGDADYNKDVSLIKDTTYELNIDTNTPEPNNFISFKHNDNEIYRTCLISKLDIVYLNNCNIFQNKKKYDNSVTKSLEQNAIAKQAIIHAKEAITNQLTEQILSSRTIEEQLAKLIQGIGYEAASKLSPQEKLDLLNSILYEEGEEMDYDFDFSLPTPKEVDTNDYNFIIGELIFDMEFNKWNTEYSKKLIEDLATISNTKIADISILSIIPGSVIASFQINKILQSEYPSVKEKLINIQNHLSSNFYGEVTLKENSIKEFTSSLSVQEYLKNREIIEKDSKKETKVDGIYQGDVKGIGSIFAPRIVIKKKDDEFDPSSIPIPKNNEDVRTNVMKAQHYRDYSGFDTHFKCRGDSKCNDPFLHDKLTPEQRAKTYYPGYSYMPPSVWDVPRKREPVCKSQKNCGDHPMPVLDSGTPHNSLQYYGVQSQMPRPFATQETSYSSKKCENVQVSEEQYDSEPKGYPGNY